MEKHPLHLKIPDLQTSEEVEKAVEKQEKENIRLNKEAKESNEETDLLPENLPNDPTVRIEAYMDRLEKIFLNPDSRVRERNIEMLRPYIYDAFIIKPENVPEAYFDLQKKVARERGQAIEEISQEMRDEMIKVIIEDQKASLDSWIDYLTSEDATYPTYFKYFTFRNIVKLSQFDKVLNKFKTRTESTTSPFPDIFREPLAQISDIYEKVAKDNKVLKEDKEIQKAFTKKFPTLYAELIQKSLASSIENKEEIKGQWVKYTKGNSKDAETLYKSLENKGTGWCTAGLSTAKTQVEAGDFYVYYTNDSKGDPTQPRIAIRMNGDSEIGEVRGILPHQNLEQQMTPILEEKLKTFGPEADKYKKKSQDMKRLTEIEKFTNEGRPLSREDLIFLYEINDSIEGFGYEKDPRIKEIRDKRNQSEDLPILFECNSEQIAFNKEDIKPNTVAYIGKWTPEVMDVLPKSITHIYEEFPEKKIFFKEIILDPEITLSETAIAKLEREGHKISDYAKDMLTKVNWQEKLRSSYEVVSFTVGSLFSDTKIHTYADIKAKAKELGLELVPSSLAPTIRLNYEKSGDWTNIAMEAIRDRGGSLKLFRCDGDGSDSDLGSNDGDDDYGWYRSSRFFFVRPK